MIQFERSFEWVPCRGMLREQIVAELITDSAASADMGDHLWVVSVNNRGPCLFCYGLQLGYLDDGGPWKDQWFVKRIPEDVGPDVYDCPMELLDMARPTNPAWRDQVRRWHEAKGE